MTLRYGCAAVLVAAGCSRVFDLDPIAGPDAPVGVSACFVDDFSEAAVSGGWIVAGLGKNVIVTTDAGRLRVDVPESTSTTQDPYGGIASSLLDLTGGSIEAELVEPPPFGSSSEAFVAIRADELNHYNLLVQHGKVIARTYDDGVLVDVPASYDPARHRVLRLRHDAATNEIVYETHGDATGWLELHRAPFQFDVTRVEVAVTAGSFDVAPAYTSRFDNVVVFGRCAP